MKFGMVVCFSLPWLQLITIIILVFSRPY